MLFVLGYYLIYEKGGNNETVLRAVQYMNWKTNPLSRSWRPYYFVGGVAYF